MSYEDPLAETIELESTQLSRRRFLSYASGVISALIAAALGVPLVRFYVGNAFLRKKARWLQLGKVADIPVNQPQLFHSSYLDFDGWRQIARRQTLYAVTTDGRTFTVFSSTCTHLGCPVHWDAQVQRFLCPCHGGVFTIDGKVIAGPPPRPLDQLEHKIEEGVLYVQVA